MTFNFLGPGLTVNVEAKVKEQIILDSSEDKQKTDKPDNVKPKDLYEFDVQSWVTFTQTCGCFVLGSSEVKSASEALNIYRQKDTVEKLQRQVRRTQNQMQGMRTRRESLYYLLVTVPAAHA